MFGMQVELSQCFRQVGTQGSGSAIVNCTDAGLVVNEYSGSVDCSSTMTGTVTVASGFTSNTCISTSIGSNSYFPSSNGANSVVINCYAQDKWYSADDGRYELSRQTSTLESRSAFDYTQDNCLENSITTEMDYCYVNRNGEECLPTNSDIDDDSFCSDNALTIYAYSSYCIYDITNNRWIQYHSDNNKAGYMNKDCSGIFDDSSYVVPYSDCLGCNRFMDLKDDSTDVAAIVAIIIGVAFGVCICCVCCGLCIFMAMYGTAALCGLCFRKNKQPENVKTIDPANSSDTINAPLHDPNYMSQQYPQQQQQQQYLQQQQLQQYPQQQQQYPGGLPASVELIHVHVPPGASPGTMILVSKSNGQQVQVVVPEGMLPGQVMEIKA